jgi:hypothetical protein
MEQVQDASETPDDVDVHHGTRSTGDITDLGRREIARTVIVPVSDEYEVVQLLYSLETYKNNRGIKKYTLYIDKMYGDDKRTKSRVTEKRGSVNRRGIVMVKDSEVGQYCRDFAYSGNPAEYWK